MQSVVQNTKFSCHIHSFFQNISGTEQFAFYRSFRNRKVFGNLAHTFIVYVIGNHHTAILVGDERQFPPQSSQVLRRQK